MLSPLTFPLDRIIDAEGRPLFEGRASQDMQAIAPLEHAVCPYAGSRHKHEKPMNVSGLRQMRSHWSDVIAGLEYLRGLYPQPAAHIRYIDLWRLCNLGEFLTPFLLYRRGDPVPNGQLPAHVADIYKIVIGLITATRQLAFASLLRGAEKIDEPLEYETLLAFVEENKLFIGPREVCAGPEPLIREIVDVLKEKPAAFDPAQKGKLLIGNEEEYLAFSYCRMNSLVLSYLYSIITQSLYARIHRAVSDGRSEEFFPAADPQLALLAGVDKNMAQLILNGIIDVAVSDDPQGGRLNAAAKQMSEALKEGNPSPAIADLLGRHAQASGLADDVARYLHLEKVSHSLSQTLKKQCLTALGLEGSLHLDAISRDFFPPDTSMRSLLGVMFGIHVLPSLQVQARGRTVMSLTEDSPWSW
jgi:hypothetical protein